MTTFTRVRDRVSGHEYDLPVGTLRDPEEPLGDPAWPDVEGAGRPPVFAERKPAPVEEPPAPPAARSRGIRNAAASAPTKKE